MGTTSNRKRRSCRKVPSSTWSSEIVVGGRQDPDICLDGLSSPHPLHDPGLDGPKELGLSFGPQVSHLVQEEGAPVGQLEASPPSFGGSGEGAPFVAEHLAFHQVFGDRGAVHPNEGPALAGVRGHEWRWPPALSRFRSLP